MRKRQVGEGREGGKGEEGMIKRGMKEEERGDWDEGRCEEGREKGVIEGNDGRFCAFD